MNQEDRPSKFGRLDGLRTVVTGSSSGIGRAIAVEFARAGADVIVHCRRSMERARSVAAEIEGLGRRGVAMEADFEQPDETMKFIDRVWSHWSGLDVCVNNAGVDLLTGDGPDASFPEKLQRLMDVDVRSTMLLSREIGGRMREAGGGVILNIGWDQADRGMEGDSGELFAASKNAVMGFTRSLALSLAPSVRVNCVAPGWIRTAWGRQAGDYWQQRVMRETPLQRWGTPEDIAAAARFLTSDDAAYITGQVINVNGGAIR